MVYWEGVNGIWLEWDNAWPEQSIKRQRRKMMVGGVSFSFVWSFGWGRCTLVSSFFSLSILSFPFRLLFLDVLVFRFCFTASEALLF